MHDPFQLSSEHGTYTVNGAITSTQIIDMAHRLIRSQPPPATLSSPDETKHYLQQSLALLEHEVFGVLLLTNKHECIEFVELFRGTIDGAAVYPREVVKEVLKRNAAAVIFAHNHPSGDPEPSRCDEAITKRLVDALKTIEVRVLDHIVVASGGCVSFAERGLI